MQSEKNMKRIVAFISFALFLFGCADTTKITSDLAYGDVVIPKTSTAYVSLPVDGAYGGKPYKGSGNNVATIIRAALLKHLIQVDLASRRENYKAALAAAKKKQADYLFYPSILHWEDRATEWSGLPDKAEIKIIVVSTDNAEVVSSVLIDGTSGLATFGGDHPQDLLPEPVSNYVSTLFN